MHELTEKLIRNIGLDIDENYNIIDQDGGNIVVFEGNKTFKCSFDNVIPPMGRGEVYFDPLNVNKIMMFSFQYFLNKLNIETGFYTKIYGQVESGGKTALILDGTKYVKSDYYYNEGFKYLDVLFRLCDYDDLVFLKQYDVQVR